MSTTVLFAALLVTGLGALTWVLLLASCLFEGVKLDKVVAAPWVALPLVGLAYVLGTVTDWNVNTATFADGACGPRSRQEEEEEEEDDAGHLRRRRSFVDWI